MKLNDKMTMREALPILYEEYGLEEEGGIDLPYVAIKVFKGFHVYLPNPEARKVVPAMAVVIPFFILYNIYIGLAEKVQIV